MNYIKRYLFLDVILQQRIRLLRSAMGTNFVFTIDNDCPHRATIVNGSIEKEHITHLERPTSFLAFDPSHACTWAMSYTQYVYFGILHRIYSRAGWPMPGPAGTFGAQYVQTLY